VSARPSCQPSDSAMRSPGGRAHRPRNHGAARARALTQGACPRCACNAKRTPEHPKEVEMGSMVTLTASDGYRLAAYRAEPQGAPRGGIVVIQEIFGVNDHIRKVTDSYAAEGYLAIAPALFDRIRPNFEVGYGPEDIAAGRELKG